MLHYSVTKQTNVSTQDKYTSAQTSIWGQQKRPDISTTTYYTITIQLDLEKTQTATSTGQWTQYHYSLNILLLYYNTLCHCMMYNCTYIPYCLKYGPGIYFFPVIVNQATKWDRRLLVKNSCAVYNLWCQWWILMEADDAWSTTLCVLLCMLQHTIPRPLNETRGLYETGRNSRQYNIYIYIYIYIYNFNTLDQRKMRADKSRNAQLSVRYKNIAQLSVRYIKYHTLILINTFHTIIKFLWWNFDEYCWKVSVFIVRDMPDIYALLPVL